MNINIVQATEENLTQTVQLFDDYRQFYEQASNLEAAKQFIQERIELQDAMIILAVDENEIGLGFVQLYPSFSSVAMQRTWILNDLFVSEHARKMGVASALMEAAEGYAEQTNALTVKLVTANDNYSAQMLYDKLGYKHVTAFKHYAKKISPAEHL